MKLKTLEISGFKSFAERTKIEFMPGITGVVGPNGSGKSNIIEAIRWVMGETSAKGLRGDRMTDVIFGGTSQKAPLNRAEVAITFDNTDHYLKSNFTELTITRRLYRDGESVYQINGSNVRLRDVHELFMDSGLGRESFSIISQGRVEAIFSAKPEDRRAIIEDVAGVYKYKKNKQRAEKELDSTNDNLSRIYDILAELGTRLEPLAEQSAIAQDFQRQKQQYETLDQSRLVLELTEWHREYEQRRAEKIGLEEAQHNYGEQTTGNNKKLMVLKKELRTAQDQQQQNQAELLVLATRVEQLLGQKMLQEERQSNQVARHDEVERQVSKIQVERREHQQLILEQKQQVAKFEQAMQQLQVQQRILDNDKTKDTLSDVTLQIETVRQTLAQHQEQVAVLEGDIRHLQERDLEKQSAGQQVVEQITALKQHLYQSKEELATQNVKLTGIQDQEVATRQILEQQRQESSRQEQTYRHKKEQWFDLLAQKERQETKLTAMQRLLDQYDGYYNGVKHIMAAQDELSGILGTVAELMGTRPKYQRALEVVLGNQLQNVVVKDEISAKTAVKYLTRHQLGRATFLPLDVIKGRFLSDEQLKLITAMDGVIGVAADLVSISAEKQVIIQYLLGTTLIVDTLDHAVAVAKKLKYRVRIVTLDGQLLNPGGSLTGGAQRHTKGGLLTQQYELQEVLAKQKELQEQVIRTEQQVKITEQRLKETQKSVSQSEETLLDLQQRMYDQKVVTNRIADSIHYQDNELQKLQESLFSSTEQTMNNKILQQEQDKKAHQDSIEQLSKHLAELQVQTDNLAQVDEKLVAQRLEVQKKLATEQGRLDRAKEYLKTYQEEQKSLEVEEQKIRQQLKKDNLGTELIAQLDHDLAESSANKEKIEQKQHILSMQLPDLDDQITMLEKTQRLIHTDYQKITKQLTLLVAQQATLETKIQQGERALEETYDTSFEFAKSQLVAQPLADIQMQLKLLKQGLDELGPVNLGAMKEYAEVKERYQFLEQQYQDLLSARENLQITMTTMDDEVATRFKQTFDGIAQHFTAVFQKLFGGGKALLELTDPDHLLTTGIDIKAQPPGKKLQQMSLLSGGEKALTAIAVLFAILEVRPVPFAILDETEAALDEANVERFSRYLHDVTDQTQFIVITHRKGTMAHADVLYGVTMQEPGISTMVSVKLRDAVSTATS